MEHSLPMNPPHLWGGVSSNECGAQSEKLNDGENIKETRLFNKDAGWKYKKVKNGSMWDICPKCVQNHALMRDL